MKIVLSILFAQLVVIGCTSKPTPPSFKKGSGDVNVGPKVDKDGDGMPDGPSDPQTSEPAPVKEPETPQEPTEISFVNTKFKGNESKLEALVKYAGTTSAKIKLESASDLAKIKVPKLLSGKTDVLVVEIYEGEALRYKATKNATTLDKSKANVVKFEDCAIQKLPWSGEANETLCGWTVSDVKN